MNDTTKTQKLRFKLTGGEEFEAEGSLEFIERQRDYFLSFIRKNPLPQQPSQTRNKLPHQPPAGTFLPREDSSVPGTLYPGLAASIQEGEEIAPQLPPSAAQAAFPGKRLWEQLLTTAGEDTLYLRRKLHLTVPDAALLLLAGGKELLEKPHTSALWLSRSLEKSGFELTRLDRVLAPSIKQGYILCQGSKRSRLYSLTPTGFAHAFVLAGKKANSLL